MGKIRTFLFTVLCFFLASCDGDVNPKDITQGGSGIGDNGVVGDGSVTFYRNPQIIIPVPPSVPTPNDDVTIGFIIIFRPGPSAVVPANIDYTVKPTYDLSLPSFANTPPATLVYVEAPPNPTAIALTFWNVFNPPNGAPLFTEGSYPAGDFYYAILQIPLGQLPEGNIDYTIELDPLSKASAIDFPKTVKFRNIVIPVVASLFAG